MLVPKLDELYNGKFSTIDEAISKFYDDAISKVDDALPVWEKMKLYHWTNEKFESFSNEKLREGAFWKWLYVTNNKESAKRRWNAAKIAKWWEDRVIDIDIPEWTKFKVFDNEADFTKFVKKDFGWDKKKAVNFLQKNYDWLNIKEWTLKANSWTYVIFDPEKTLYNTTPTTTPANSPLVKANQKLSPKAKKPLIKAEVASKVDDALPVWEKMWTQKKMELSDLWGVKTVKPNNQLKFNQWADYEAVRLVVNDKDAMVARYWALRNKDMQAITWKWKKLTEWEKIEMKRILKVLWVDDNTATARHQFLKDEAKKVRSRSDQVLHEIKDDFRTTKPAFRK